ncbi:MAG: peptidoglycan-binding protein, partial [Xanthomonadales bacterium]|nr:peptidoglycan-binding protein [Xanthomonadales bacterium]
ARGHDIGAADGMVGTATRRAIQAEQQRLGLLPADGRAGTRILEALRGQASPADPASPAADPPGATPLAPPSGGSR